MIGTLWAAEGLGGDDRFSPRWLTSVDGGSGRDTVDASLLDHGVEVFPGDESIAGRWHVIGGSGKYEQPLQGLERFLLTDKRDRFEAGTARTVLVNARGSRDVVQGGSGPDVLLGGAGDDVLEGRSGSDRLRPGPGADLVDGGSDHDSCGSSADDVVRRCEVPIEERG